LARRLHLPLTQQALNDTAARRREPCLMNASHAGQLYELTTRPANRMRILVAEDERPARSFLVSLLAACADVELVGEASTGTEAVEMIMRLRPDLVLLDLQMPELDGLGVVRFVRRDKLPLVAFVTAYEEYAVRAFEMNAIDYLLKPVDRLRLRATLDRAHERLERAELRVSDSDRLKAVAFQIESASAPMSYLRRIPVRRRDDIVIVPVDQLSAIVADGELLHLTTRHGERHTITYRL
jgi:two-component system, LytTR family, response regulator